MIDWNTRVVLSYRAEAWRNVWNVSYNVLPGIDLTSSSLAKIEDEVKAVGANRSYYPAMRSACRPKFVSIDSANRKVLIEEAEMLSD